MTQLNSLRPLGLLVSLLGLSGFALLGAACSGDGSPDEHVDSDEAALTGAQCSYFDVNGKNQICHHTGSASHPYTIIKTSEEGCINGHAGHAHDYITSTDPTSPTYDPTCQGGGCLPVGAPTDATLGCCDGLVDQGGTCVDPCAVQPCENGGACAASGTSYTCSCAPGYSGTNCEINIDESSGRPALPRAALADAARGGASAGSGAPDRSARSNGTEGGVRRGSSWPSCSCWPAWRPRERPSHSASPRRSPAEPL
ncbi:MAG: calcium-binding EGF-like domain-containing protein [Byssovorax sp.]